jgi:hypothetical protein
MALETKAPVVETMISADLRAPVAMDRPPLAGERAIEDMEGDGWSELIE